MPSLDLPPMGPKQSVIWHQLSMVDKQERQAFSISVILSIGYSPVGPQEKARYRRPSRKERSGGYLIRRYPKWDQSRVVIGDRERRSNERDLCRAGEREAEATHPVS